MKADLAVGRVKHDWQAGMLQIRLFAGEFGTRCPPEAKWDQDPPVPDPQYFTLLCNLFQCKNLPPADSNGSADPYVKFYCNGTENQTPRGEKMVTLNPQYYHSIPLEFRASSIEDAPPLLITVWDYDQYSADDLMGVLTIDLKTASRETQFAPRPQWYQLGLGEDVKDSGEILMSFNIFNDYNVPRFNIVQVLSSPPARQVSIEINVLGLRNLKPALGWLPVNKAFIKFDINSLSLPDEGNNSRLLQTQPIESGANPNIATVLQFNASIPIDTLYCPCLSVSFIQCVVHDYLMGGLSKPVIGTFSIDIGKVVEDQQERKTLVRSNSISNAKQALEQISEIRPQTTFYKPTYFSDHEQQEEESYESEEEYLNTNQYASSSYLSVSEARNGRVILMPQFDIDRRGKLVEINQPDENFYMRIGYNRRPEDGKMQYRYQVQTPLEKSEYIEKSPFHQFPIMKGQNRGLESSLKKADRVDITGSKSNIRTAGYFKGLVRIIPAEQVNARKKRVQDIKERRLSSVTSSIASNTVNSYTEVSDDDDEDFEDIARAIMHRVEVCVRVYILDAWEVESKDVDSPSDPYIRLKLGGQVLSDKENYILDAVNPQFYRHFDMTTYLPGPSMLKIQMWDYDNLFSDDKIGTTTIDLEDRFFSNKWQRLKYKPIETRKIYHKSSRRPQGVLRLWLEIHPSNNIPDPIDVSPKPPLQFQARLIIWQCKGVAAQDWEGVSDIYARAWVNNRKPKETDTHYRAASGQASWNYRMLFDVDLPGVRNNVTVQIWDRDFFSSNDFIGESSFTFENEAKYAWEENERVKYLGTGENITDRTFRRRTEKFWIPMKTKSQQGIISETGQILLSFELVPMAQALRNPVGEGRSEPNVDPHLPEPTGRFKWTWNPIKLAARMIGPELKFKILCAICLLCCCTLIILLIPLIFTDAVSAMLFG